METSKDTGSEWEQTFYKKFARKETNEWWLSATPLNVARFIRDLLAKYRAQGHTLGRQQGFEAGLNAQTSFEAGHAAALKEIRDKVAGMREKELPDAGSTRVEAAMYSYAKAKNATIDKMLSLLQNPKE